MNNTSSINKVFSEIELNRFIELSEDKASFHINDDIAIKGGFQKKICHGVMTLMPISKILGMILPGEGYIIMELQTKFHSPVYCDETYYYKFKEVYANKDLGISKICIKIFDQSNKKISITNATCKKLI